MEKFSYKIRDQLGIHARPAGVIVREAQKYQSTITIQVGEKSANATRIMALMALAIKEGQEITVSAEGADEQTAIEAMKQLLEENL